MSIANLHVQVQTILKDEKASNLKGDKLEEFWVLAAALKEFVEQEGKGELPVSGTIPDMTSDTHGYITLQRMYHIRLNTKNPKEITDKVNISW